MTEVNKTVIIFSIIVNSIPTINFLIIMNRIGGLDPNSLSYINETIRTDIFVNFFNSLILFGIIVLLFLLKNRVISFDHEYLEYMRKLLFLDGFLIILYFSWFSFTPTTPYLNDFYNSLLISGVLAFLGIFLANAFLNFPKLNSTDK